MVKPSAELQKEYSKLLKSYRQRISRLEKEGYKPLKSKEFKPPKKKTEKSLQRAIAHLKKLNIPTVLGKKQYQKRQQEKEEAKRQKRRSEYEYYKLICENALDEILSLNPSNAKYPWHATTHKNYMVSTFRREMVKDTKALALRLEKGKNAFNKVIEMFFYAYPDNRKGEESMEDLVEYVFFNDIIKGDPTPWVEILGNTSSLRDYTEATEQEAAELDELGW